MMQILETHAESEKQALELSAKYLTVDADLLKLKVHKKGASRFLGFGSKQPNIYYVYAIEGKTPRDVVIKGVLSTMIHKMGYRVKVVNIREIDDNKVYVELSSPSVGNIIGRKGKTLESLQVLVNTMLRRFLEKPLSIILDIEDYRKRRQTMLEEMCREMAAQVVKKGQAKTTEPLSPYERKIIHLSLRTHGKVVTESIGEGVFKKIQIRLIHDTSPSASQKDPDQDDPTQKGENTQSNNSSKDKDSDDAYDSEPSNIEKEQRKQFEQDTEPEN